jgi:hypothetical protein
MQLLLLFSQLLTRASPVKQVARIARAISGGLLQGLANKADPAR